MRRDDITRNVLLGVSVGFDNKQVNDGISEVQLKEIERSGIRRQLLQNLLASADDLMRRQARTLCCRPASSTASYLDFSSMSAPGIYHNGGSVTRSLVTGGPSQQTWAKYEGGGALKNIMGRKSWLQRDRRLQWWPPLAVGV